VWGGIVGVEQSLLRMVICLVSGIECRVDIFWAALPRSRHGRDASWLYRNQLDGDLDVTLVVARNK